MKLFLDTSVLLAACGSEKGASRAVFDFSRTQGWALMSSPWAVSEVERNLAKLPSSAVAVWMRLRLQLVVVDDVVVLDRPVIFKASKDRPILFTALAWSDTLLTLDREDFADLLDGRFYGLRVLLPFVFLEGERAAGRLKTPRP